MLKCLSDTTKQRAGCRATKQIRSERCGESRSEGRGKRGKREVGWGTEKRCSTRLAHLGFRESYCLYCTSCANIYTLLGRDGARMGGGVFTCPAGEGMVVDRQLTAPCMDVIRYRYTRLVDERTRRVPLSSSHRLITFRTESWKNCVKIRGVV
jgi:hypothetical protein